MEKCGDNFSGKPEPSTDFVALAAKLAADSSKIGDLGFARIDHDRTARCGFPEFIFGEGKTVDQLLAIVPEILKHSPTILATRLKPEAGRALAEKFPQGKYDPAARTFIIDGVPEKRGLAAIVTAGSSDLPVALEAKYTLDACGIGSELIADVGIAALPRLLAAAVRLRRAAVCIAVAGMEGALPSVVAGLVGTPVIGVPSSVGYGSSLNGITPMLGMLNSCANGLLVVNIDNGFGAGCAAARIINSTTGK